MRAARKVSVFSSSVAFGSNSSARGAKGTPASAVGAPVVVVVDDELVATPASAVGAPCVDVGGSVGGGAFVLAAFLVVGGSGEGGVGGGPVYLVPASAVDRGTLGLAG